MKQFALFLLACSPIALAATLINYQGGQPASAMGSSQLEGQELGDHIYGNTANVYIKPGNDPKGVPALSFHRDAHFRRAEVKGAGTYSAGKSYRVNYRFSLAKTHSGLVIFQWKKEDKVAAPVQNIPFNLQFTGGTLTIGYTAPDQGYATIWSANSPLSLNTQHHIELEFDTATSHPNTLRMSVDGAQVFSRSDLHLWTGATYPKFGIYRGEKAATGDTSPDLDHVFDSWVYQVVVEEL